MVLFEGVVSQNTPRVFCFGVFCIGVVCNTPRVFCLGGHLRTSGMFHFAGLLCKPMVASFFCLHFKGWSDEPPLGYFILSQ